MTTLTLKKTVSLLSLQTPSLQHSMLPLSHGQKQRDTYSWSIFLAFLVSEKQLKGMVNVWATLSLRKTVIKLLNKQIFPLWSIRGCRTFLAVCSWNVWVWELPHMVSREYTQSHTTNLRKSTCAFVALSFSLRLVLGCYVLTLLNSITVLVTGGSLLGMTSLWLRQCTNKYIDWKRVMAEFVLVIF